MNVSEKKAVLILEDGAEFEGYSFGAPLSREAGKARTDGSGPFKDRGYGEVVFNTSMTGYQEILTDPSYYGQMVCMTYPHIGNTGVNIEDPESKGLWGAGLIVHELCDEPSNWRSSESLDAYLKKHDIPGVFGVDTRALTRHLRSRGVVRGIMLAHEERGNARQLLAELPGFEGRDLIGEVTTREAYRWKSTVKSSGPFKYRVVAMDFGVKWNLLRSLEEQGCEIDVVPANAKAEDILARKPDGVFLSNGPGDPAAAPYAAKTVAQLVGKVPIFGVCMGHQILALAVGGKTYKLKFGHRGGNQPVLDRSMDRVEISSHNHGYAVDGNSLPPNVQVTHINLNDKTVEGMAIPDAKAFSVQYHPEACPGPHDSVALFERFVDLMKKK
jgi:carbamoyl-phosphate synthase small subunit